MKLKYIATSLICVGLLFVAANASEDTDIKIDTQRDIRSIKDVTPIVRVKAPKVEYQVEADLSTESISLPIYRANIVDINRNDKNDKIADIFRFDAEKEDFNKNSYGVSSRMITDKDGRTIEYFDSGAIFFSKENLVPEKSEDILSLNGLDKESAKKIYQEMATNFLGEHGLLREGSQFANVSYATVQRIEQQDVNDLKKGIQPDQKAKVVAIAVHFTQNIKEIPTWGAGSHTTVYFDESGISGYFDQIREFSQVEKSNKELISSAEAVERYISNESPKNLLRTAPIKIEKVTIKNVKLVYHLDAVNKPQEEIKPYYLITGVFEGENFEGDLQEAKFEWLESAEG